MPSEVQRRRKPQKLSTSAPGEALPALSVDDLADEGETALVARGKAYAERYAQIEHEPETLLRNIAVVLVALRRHHDDMRGRSVAYRKAAAEIYRAADIAPNTRVRSATETKDRMQQSVRWHIGNLLRDELDERELKDLNLSVASPLERQRAHRAIRSALSKSSKAAQSPETLDIPVQATADHLRLANAARNIVAQLSPDVIDNAMTDGQRVKLHEELGALQEAIRVLRRHTGKRRSGA
ncbi:hypothetical protein [Streptomyces sparsogenes]|uniref:hypothetical protein n=1 Tax=Streptomyces sparsogenes TaxID=67365 RepID=UPI0033F7FD01